MVSTLPIGAKAMADRYRQLAGTPLGRFATRRVGLPSPIELERHEPGQPLVTGAVLLGGVADGRIAGAAARVLAAANCETHTTFEQSIRAAAANADLDAKIFNPATAARERSFKALLFDASAIRSTERLDELYAFFHPTIRRVCGCGRIIVLGTAPEHCEDPREATAQRALEGFMRAAGKEVRGGGTAQLLYVAPGAEDAISSTLRFFLSPRSAYVSGQVVRLGVAALPAEPDWERPLDGRVALVTGAARGIGAAIAQTLARDGAHVVGLDVPALADELAAVTGPLHGSQIMLDITAPSAPAEIAEQLQRAHGGVDVVVHNAGVTRDRTLGRMSAQEWAAVIDINVSSAERIDEVLLERATIREHGRIVGVASISGIAGNSGQTNYSTSKAAVIGRVQSMAGVLAERRITINAVAPGFIETQMTAAMPFAVREAGRRMNSLSQGGLPRDVAETIAWLASPASAAVSGNVVRVCGQSLLGA